LCASVATCTAVSARPRCASVTVQCGSCHAYSTQRTPATVSRATFISLAVGPHIFRVEAIDTTGNADPMPAA
jgi:hypothetical protein